MSQTILLFGRNGQIGWELERSLAPLGRVVPLGRGDVDLAAPDEIRSAIRAHRPSLVVNAAAYTRVDGAESEPEMAFAINAAAPGVMAEEARRIGARMVHYSTDYVFDGTKRAPYVEDDPTAPLSTYGRSKKEGETRVRAGVDEHLILRTSWVYGARGENFLRTMLRLFREREQLRVVADQIGAPTWSRMIASATAFMVCSATRQAPMYGTYHVTAAGETSWHGFASAIHQMVEEPVLTGSIEAILTGEYPTAAERPRYSVLAASKLERDFALQLPSWDQTLRLVMEEMG